MPAKKGSHIFQPSRLYVYFRGCDRTLKEISELTGIKYNTLYQRYKKYGTDLEAPVGKHKRKGGRKKGD